MRVREADVAHTFALRHWDFLVAVFTTNISSSEGGVSIHSLALGFESQVSSESLSNQSAHAGNHTYMALTPSFDKLALRLAGGKGPTDSG